MHTQSKTPIPATFHHTYTATMQMKSLICCYTCSHTSDGLRTAPLVKVPDLYIASWTLCQGGSKSLLYYMYLWVGGFCLPFIENTEAAMYNFTYQHRNVLPLVWWIVLLIWMCRVCTFYCFTQEMAGVCCIRARLHLHLRADNYCYICRWHIDCAVGAHYGHDMYIVQLVGCITMMNHNQNICDVGKAQRFSIFITTPHYTCISNLIEVTMLLKNTFNFDTKVL